MGLRSLFKRKKSNSSASSQSGAANPGPFTISRSSSTTSSRFQMEELEQVFKKFDVNGDGKISASELASILDSLGAAATEEEVRSMIREADADGDGCIDLNEFIELNTKGVGSDEIMENLKDAFSVYDMDGNGSITVEELHKVMKSLGEECSMAECRKMIGGVDSDGDGMISFEEFKVMMMAGSRLQL